MSYRRMAMHGFLDDLFGDEEAEVRGEASNPDMPTGDMGAPIGTRLVFWECASGNQYPVVGDEDPPEKDCAIGGMLRTKDGKWQRTYGSTAATSDNPVSTFLRDLFGGGSTPNPLPAPVVTPPPTSYAKPPADAGAGVQALYTDAPPTSFYDRASPTQIAVGALVVLGLGYAAYKYL